MQRRFVIAAVAAVLVLGAVGGGIAIAGGVVGDDDKPLTGATLDKATAAALEHTGGGTVIETEAGDDGAAYGVEVRLANGRVIEVELDENFHVIGQANDDDSPGEQEDDEND
jgi:uncharacterized membrane protein YkoI